MIVISFYPITAEKTRKRERMLPPNGSSLHFSICNDKAVRMACFWAPGSPVMLPALIEQKKTGYFPV
jgi:hypothetical protein